MYKVLMSKRKSGKVIRSKKPNKKIPVPANNNGTINNTPSPSDAIVHDNDNDTTTDDSGYFYMEKYRKEDAGAAWLRDNDPVKQKSGSKSRSKHKSGSEYSTSPTPRYTIAKSFKAGHGKFS